MRWSKALPVCLLLSVVLSFAFYLPRHTKAEILQAGKANVAFKWAFGAMVGAGNDKKFVPITRDTVLKTGDEIKMVVNVTKDCFVYVLYQNSKGEINLLFPYEFKQFLGDYKSGKNYYIPKARTWFVLDDNKGRETFHLLASAERLLQLESLVSQYSEANPSKKAGLAQQILTEIRDVRKHYRTFATLAEKPIAIGGNVRGVEKSFESMRRPDVSTITSEISANNFFGKTLTIDHQ